jgi:hypothetical protein
LHIILFCSFRELELYVHIMYIINLCVSFLIDIIKDCEVVFV